MQVGEPKGKGEPAPEKEAQASAGCRQWIVSLAAACGYTVVGVLLAFLPWLPGWDQNYFSGGSHGWFSVWMNPYFRGAVSGVGILNLYLSFLELLGLVKAMWKGRALPARRQAFRVE